MQTADKLIRIDQIDEFHVFQSLQLPLTHSRNGEPCPLESFHIPFDGHLGTFEFIVEVAVQFLDLACHLFDASQLGFDISANGDLASVCNSTNSRGTIHHWSEIIHSFGDWVNFAYWSTPVTSHADRQPAMQQI